VWKKIKDCWDYLVWRIKKIHKAMVDPEPNKWNYPFF